MQSLHEFLKQHNIHYVFYPFLGEYDVEHQPNIFDIPVEHLHFDYIKWRPKLQTQLQHIAPYTTNPTVIDALPNRIQKIRLVIYAFKTVQWQWLPLGVENRYVGHHNELHDIPIQWQQAHQIEHMQQMIDVLQHKVNALEKHNQNPSYTSPQMNLKTPTTKMFQQLSL